MGQFARLSAAVLSLGLCLSAVTQAAALYGTTHVGGSTAPSLLWRICPSSGEAFPVGPIGFVNVGSIAFHPLTGVLYGVGRRPGSMQPRVLITIDPTTGIGSEIGPLIHSWTLNGGGYFDLTFRPSDAALFLLSFLPEQPTVTLYQIDISTGEATAIGSAGPSGVGNAMSFESDGALWMVQDTGVMTLYRLDPTDAAVIDSTPVAHSGFPPLIDPRANGMVGEHVGGPFYLSLNDGSAGSGPNYLALLDSASGTVTHVGLSVPGLDGLALDSGGTLRMEQTIRASSTGQSWEWPLPISFEFVVGSFSRSGDIGSYRFDAGGSGSGSSLAAAQLVPSGEAIWYLLRPACADASWSSGGAAECPAPACAAGGRDELLP